MSVTVVNLQRKVPINAPEYRRFTDNLTNKIEETVGKCFAVAFVSDGRMKQLNSFFRGKDLTTDVLSFPHKSDEFDSDASNLGDIVISAEQAALQAEENGLSLENEVKQLILHGLLHLCGYDHENDKGEMNRRELELRDKLGI